jgi:hypothetical protein
VAVRVVEEGGVSTPRLIIQRTPSDPDEGGRCFCCRDRIEPGVSQHEAIDAGAEFRGLVCLRCATASDDELRAEMLDLAGRLYDWASDLIDMTKRPIRRVNLPRASDRLH